MFGLLVEVRHPRRAASEVCTSSREAFGPLLPVPRVPLLWNAGNLSLKISSARSQEGAEEGVLATGLAEN